MTKYTMDMVLEYAKVFPQNADMGDPKSDQKWLRDLHKEGGKTTVNCYFTSEDQIKQLEEDGVALMVTNPRTGEQQSRIKEGRAEFGIGKYLPLKRKVVDVREYMDTKAGELKELDLGGYPKVVDLRDPENGQPDWDPEELGFLGNGTQAKIKFDVYKGETIRLEAIGITELVEYEMNEPNDPDKPFVV